jgi:outer membrane protein assembly factor BamE (lipoprotein component of BamABCDE complex)
MKTLLSIGWALVLACCAAYDGYALRAGTSTESEVRSTMGTPALEMPANDGSKELYYPRGPLGGQTYVAEVGRDGVLKGVRQVLKDDIFYGIQPGMTEDDILRMIGPPREKAHFPRQDQTAWDYKYVDNWGYPSIFSVMFDPNGVVVSKFSRRIEPRRMF